MADKTDSARIVLIYQAIAFAQSSITQSEHCVTRADMERVSDSMPLQPGRAVRVTFEFVDEGVLCDGGGE